jgi:hypothetical protein
MAQSLILPAIVLLIGLAAALMFTAPTYLRKQADATQPAAEAS